MAIIQQRPGALETLPQTLLQIMVNKQQLELQKEDQKIRQADLKIRTDTAEFEQSQAVAGQQAAGQLLPQLLQALPQEVTQDLNTQNLDPAGKAALVQQLQGFSQFLQQRELVAAQTELVGEEVQSLLDTNDVFGLRVRSLRADIAAREDEPTNKEVFDAEQNLAKERIAQDDARLAQDFRRTFAEISSTFGANAAGLLLSVPLPSRDEEALTFASEAEAIKNRISLSATQFEIDAPNKARLSEAFDAAGGDPQTIVDSILSQDDLDDDTKARLFAAIQGAFPTRGLRVPPEKRNAFARFLGILGFELSKSRKVMGLADPGTPLR